jgi:hypothetical protein
MNTHPATCVKMFMV